MNIYLILVALISLSAAFAYINHRFIKMPFVIGLFFLSTILSLVILSERWWDSGRYLETRAYLAQIELSNVILDVMLGFLLFAGSLHTRWTDIRLQLRPITFFAVLGVVFSTLLIGGAIFWVSGLLDAQIDLLHCFIFGALISPTDPIAVLGILTKANVSKKVESTIVGESLFNDGIGVVIFVALFETLKLGNDHIDFGHFGVLFLQEAVGGMLFGLALGYALHYLLKSIDNYETEVLLTIAFVMSGYALSNYFHLSGALAMVVMGLLVGNYKREASMSDRTQEYVHKFWELIDVILNAVLFISIGFVLVFIDFTTAHILIGLLAVLVVLIARVIVIWIPALTFKRLIQFTNNETKIIIWGGLRGGLSIALVLSLPAGEAKDMLVIATYFCVVFSILLQGLTVGKLAKRLSEK
ncbi:cation:proton antiporter [Flavobacterium suzhouense]|uniref:Cation:proton antiporter n=1 Tax=Flavobacterium suzhouense TaxID=1529638 RepID=A0ABW5NUP4_9FLAO